ncbi:Atlastin [Pseudolycoriella hygida]|uniref:Atlastin n=1 Tax=Pseudolycoriella hygida TaxID=35572 RepID=A0A9Q0NHF7_9DIPT|nr:Atlastin [Pseudolycoriella hygida]
MRLNFLIFIVISRISAVVTSVPPTAVQIVTLENHVFHVRSNPIDKLLNDPHIKDRSLFIFSISGLARSGKSFFLNFPLKYLWAQYEKHDLDDWMGEYRVDKELNGFRWSGGKKRQTTGIWMYSHIFTHDYSNGDKVAIIVLDTQGLHDHDSSIKDCTAIFAISTLMSSLQCYNVMQNIQENNLRDLHFFTEYARLALNQTTEIPFQKLLFLVRDWPYAKDVNYGYGDTYMEEILTATNEQTPEMHQMRNDINSTFEQINAFLMPYPGTYIAEGMAENSSHVDTPNVDAKFIKYVKMLVPSIFAPNNLILKRINGQKMHARDFKTFLEKYVEIFNGNELPDAKSSLMATAEASLSALIKECLNLYEERMFHVIILREHLTISELFLQHETSKEAAWSLFRNRPKFGGRELILSFRRQLEHDISTKYLFFEMENERIGQLIAEREKALKKAGAVTGGSCSLTAWHPILIAIFTISVCCAYRTNFPVITIPKFVFVST